MAQRLRKLPYTAYELTDYDEINEAIKKVPNTDVRRILRTALRACKRLNGTPVYSAWEDLYVLRCYTEEPLPHLVFSHSGKGGFVSMSSVNFLAEFKLPEDWKISMIAGVGERDVYGFRLEIKYMEEEWSVNLAPVSSKLRRSPL
ncbi:MAG: hypothetical protein ACTSVA_01170 [Candidatus Njordarchaeales archaeon]